MIEVVITIIILSILSWGLWSISQGNNELLKS